MAMVVLVRCFDGTCSVALESCLDDLAGEGLITAYLVNGEWIPVLRDTKLIRLQRCSKRSVSRAAVAVA